MNESRTFGELIRQGMTAHGLTGKELARTLGWSESVVSELVNDKRETVPADMVRRLHDVLGIPLRQMAESLNYLDPETREPDAPYVIAHDDPIAEIVAMLEDASPAKLEKIRQLIKVLSDVLP